MSQGAYWQIFCRCSGSLWHFSDICEVQHVCGKMIKDFWRIHNIDGIASHGLLHVRDVKFCRKRYDSYIRFIFLCRFAWRHLTYICKAFILSKLCWSMNLVMYEIKIYSRKCFRWHEIGFCRWQKLWFIWDGRTFHFITPHVNCHCLD